ncbi:MAG: hypothetical protein CSA49_06795 [Gammaproteobacteria bacterium]|nr:MAG: hypothetical protein CSA49_06795 [Gammaproteobacteria bacterium]
MTESTTETTQQQQETLSASQVVDYLIHHPEFFVENEHLLADLILPHASGSAASLIERQATVLRERNSELRQRLSNLIDTARENDTIFRLTKSLGLTLLEANSLEDTVRAIHHSLYREFKVDCASLLLFDAPHIQNKGFITQTSSEAAKRVLGNLLRGERVHCSALRENEFKYLFPTSEATSGSAAIVPLHYKKEIGILAIGSYNSAHFDPAMETAFISYMSQIISRKIAPFLETKNTTETTETTESSV